MKIEISEKDEIRIEQIMWYIEKDSIIKHKDLIKCLEDGKYKMSKKTMEQTLEKFSKMGYFGKIKTEKNVYYFSYADMGSDIINKKNVYKYFQNEINKTIKIINKIKILFTKEVHINREWTKIDTDLIDSNLNHVSLKYISREKENTIIINDGLRFDKKEDQEAYKKELRELYIKSKDNINKLCKYVKEIHSVKPTTKARLKLRRQIFNKMYNIKKINDEIVESQKEHCPWCGKKLLYKKPKEKKYDIYYKPNGMCKKCKKTYVMKTEWRY